MGLYCFLGEGSRGISASVLRIYTHVACRNHFFLYWNIHHNKENRCLTDSILAGTLEPTYRQLQTMKLDKSPFVIISVIGQELLAQAKYVSAVKVLESALKIGTCSLKLRGSVFSALSSAYWALNSLDKVTVRG